MSEPQGNAADAKRARKRLFVQAREHVPYIAVQTSDGPVFLVATTDQQLGRSLFVARSRGEMRTLETVFDVLKGIGRPLPRKPTLLDIGANIGTTAITALVVHRFGRVYAIEPEEGNLRLLRANAALNGVAKRLHVIPLAVSDRDSGVTLSLCPDNSGDHRVVSDPSRAAGRRVVEVESATVDGLVASGRLPADPDLVWIDAQGHEPAILRGAGRLLASGAPVVVEVDGSREAAGEFDELAAVLHASGRQMIDLRGIEGRFTPSMVPPDNDEFLAALQREGRISDVLLLPPRV